MDYQKETKNTDLAAYLFHQGTNYRAWEYMGAHRVGRDVVFRVFAPHASAVCVVGSFNAWSDTAPMTRVTENGVWEAAVPGEKVREGSLYKFKLITPAGVRYKADPYARATGCPPETASVYTELYGETWHDDGWMSYRRRTMMPPKYKQRPINVYELHVGSFRRHEDGRSYTYRELANELIPYVKQMGYTHIELMPVMEYGEGSSWGYATTGYYAPTARYGTPRDFLNFVDAMHGAGVGVILDWIPAYFGADAHGPRCFDGAPLYECPTDSMGATRRFDIARPEVECFLISCAAYWAETYHIDGLRVCGVASMLREDVQSLPFFRKLNAMMSTRFPEVMMIAEATGEDMELTTLQGGGPGFTLRWNTGWVSDALAYHATPPAQRPAHHKEITFSLMYSFRERYMLPLSHDEVSQGKKSLLDRMPGDYLQKFAGCRAWLGYMMAHPGKKLLFMGCEIGQFRPWSDREGVEWFLLDYDQHAALQQYVAELNHLYLDTPALYEQDDGWDGFRWIDADNAAQAILSCRRIDSHGREVIAVINFTPTAYEAYSVGVPDAGVYEEIFNSDATRFGGSGMTNEEPIRTKPERLHDLPDTLSFRLAPLSAVFFRCRRKQPRSKK